jgi:hypothetical protein
VILARDCAVFELRQYTLHPDVRDEFVVLFGAELVEPQEAVGMRVLGQFIDLDRPDVFVWIRGFADMAARESALHAFYDGPVWARYRDEANAMMIDSDDVLLLELASADDAGGWDDTLRSPVEAGATQRTALLVEICPLAPQHTGEFLHHHESMVAPLARKRAGRSLPTLRTLHAVNTFPRLPVREDVHVAVTVTKFPDLAAADALRTDPATQVAAAVRDLLADGPPHVLRLRPVP